MTASEPHNSGVIEESIIANPEVDVKQTAAADTVSGENLPTDATNNENADVKMEDDEPMQDSTEGANTEGNANEPLQDGSKLAVDPTDEEEIHYSGIIRSTALNVRGVDELSTKEVENWVNEFAPDHPFDVEWIDDHSLNLAFYSEEACALAFYRLARDSVLVGAEAEKAQVRELIAWPSKLKVLDQNAKPLENHPDTELVIRYALTTDKKEKGARDRSRYYLLHGEPEDRLDHRARLARTAPDMRQAREEDGEELFADRFDATTGSLEKRRRRDNRRRRDGSVSPERQIRGQGESGSQRFSSRLAVDEFGRTRDRDSYRAKSDRDLTDSYDGNDENREYGARNEDFGSRIGRDSRGRRHGHRDSRDDDRREYRDRNRRYNGRRHDRGYSRGESYSRYSRDDDLNESRSDKGGRYRRDDDGDDFGDKMSDAHNAKQFDQRSN